MNMIQTYVSKLKKKLTDGLTYESIDQLIDKSFFCDVLGNSSFILKQ